MAEVASLRDIRLTALSCLSSPAALHEISNAGAKKLLQSVEQKSFYDARVPNAEAYTYAQLGWYKFVSVTDGIHWRGPFSDAFPAGAFDQSFDGSEVNRRLSFQEEFVFVVHMHIIDSLFMIYVSKCRTRRRARLRREFISFLPTFANYNSL